MCWRDYCKYTLNNLSFWLVLTYSSLNILFRGWETYLFCEYFLSPLISGKKNASQVRSESNIFWSSSSKGIMDEVVPIIFNFLLINKIQLPGVSKFSIAIIAVMPVYIELYDWAFFFIFIRYPLLCTTKKSELLVYSFTKSFISPLISSTKMLCRFCPIS